MRSAPFKRQTLALFFIVSLIPALTVAAIWYLNTQLNTSGSIDLSVSSFVLPIFLLGILPALVLSLVFAELLSRPVRRIHEAILLLARGHYGDGFDDLGTGEFNEIGIALTEVASKLERTLSESASEKDILEAERNKLRSVLNSMTDGVFALDKVGRIMLFNKAASELTGHPMTDVAGQLAEKVMPFRKNGELVMARWLATHQGTEHKVGQWRGLELYRADGSSLTVDVGAVTLRDDPNGINALVTFHDLTKSQQLEDMKIDFVALAAHELRTPLTELRGYLDMMTHETKGLSKADRDMLDRSMANANELGGLINNLLNVANIEHGELNYQLEPTNYGQFLRDMVAELHEHPQLEQRKVKLKLPPHLGNILGDTSGLHQVFTNLINNSVAHTTSAKGQIDITVTASAKTIETTIHDNGTGLPAAAIPHLFTKFYRVHGLKSAHRGTGLGLYICKSIVELHGGHIWAESELGHGTTVGFSLPVSTVATKPHSSDNTVITRGAHGWIKEDSLHRR